jgi:hypothetical protein
MNKMKKFLALYRMDMDAMKKMMTETSAEDRKKGKEEWGTWMKAHTADMADMGGPVGKNTEVSASGAKDVSNDLGGYTVFQAESKEDVVKLLADCPHMKMPGAVVDLMEIPAMEM